VIRQFIGGILLGMALAFVAASCVSLAIDLKRGDGYIEEIELTPVPAASLEGR
jgi:hypothetical protein